MKALTRWLVAVVPLLMATPLVRAGMPATTQATPASQPAELKSFMRFVDDGHSGGRLEAAVVTYRNPAGVVVKLVSAVHIGEKSYFEDLNKSFQNEDAVLYEMVKDRAAGVPKPGEQGENPISKLQHFLKNTLGLEFQLDIIDYSRPNFVHADLDRQTFEKMQEERGETFQALLLKQLMTALSKPLEASDQRPEPTLENLIEMFTRPDMERQIKLLLARQMDGIEAGAMGLDGPGGSVIVTERNKAAIKVLSDTISAGKKKISIFYGAAHMPDMAKRLHEMGFAPIDTQWNMAWDLAIRADQPSAMEKLLKDFVGRLEQPEANPAEEPADEMEMVAPEGA